MAEEHAGLNASAAEVRTNYFACEPDWFLRSLVDMVNGTDLNFGVTLQVGGLLVSGLLVSGDKYFSGFADLFVGGIGNVSPDAALSIRSAFEQYGELYGRGEGVPRKPPAYIHLKNARFFSTSGTPVPANTGVWWRGRLSEVGGFVLGTLGAGD